MSYLILARKYRPQKFADLTGQETTTKILQAAITQGRVAPAYLFSGTRGTGKTTTARLFAKALNCKNLKAAEPCNACSSCDEIAKSSSMDVLELDAASHTGVDNIREAIINTVAYASARDKYKVFIIDEVHMLSTPSFNALLKTLEEPPPHVTFILATTEYHKIPATIASRCQRFRFLPLTQKEIGLTLKKIGKDEKIAVTDDALSLVARAASGSMRDALSLLDQVISHFGSKGEITREGVEDVLGIVREDFLLDFLDQVAAKNAKGALEAVGKLLTEGHDLSYFLKEVREAFRQMLIEKCGYADEDAFAARKKPLPTAKFSQEELLRAGQMLSKCAEQMRWNDSPRMVFECYAVKLCQEVLDAPEILKRLENLEQVRPSSASAPSARPVSVAASAPIVSRPAPQASVAVQPLSPSLSRPAPAAPSPVSVPPSVSASSSVPVLGQAWQKIMARVQQEKPSLYAILLQAVPSWSGDAAELGFAKQFSLDNAKRSSAFLESVFSAELNKRVQVVFKIVQGQVRPPVEDDDTVVVESLHTTFEAMEHGETFEPIEGTPSPIEDAIEDEGTKKFLSVFHGKVTRHQAGS